jgi:hypothetical protein
MLEHYYKNEQRVVKVQAIWRGVLQRREYAKLKEANKWKTSKAKGSYQVRI